MIIDSFERAWKGAKKKNWDSIYIAVDIHDTIFYGNYKSTELPTEFTPGAQMTLKMLSDRNDIVLILYTCSHPHEIEKYKQHLVEHGINFIHANINPSVIDNELGCYSHKPYFNVLLEDKAGFNCETDWFEIYDWFINRPDLGT